MAIGFAINFDEPGGMPIDEPFGTQRAPTLARIEMANGEAGGPSKPPHFANFPDPRNGPSLPKVTIM